MPWRGHNLQAVTAQVDPLPVVDKGGDLPRARRISLPIEARGQTPADLSRLNLRLRVFPRAQCIPAAECGIHAVDRCELPVIPHVIVVRTRIFEGVFPWAGKLRETQSSDLTSSLDSLFDKLARENRLKGLDGDTWSKRSAEYLRELTAIEPFPDGNEIASLEFFRQLAGENSMTLRYLNGIGQPFCDELHSPLQRTQSNNLRRILMLAVDPCPTVRPSRVSEGRNIVELIAPT